MNLYGFVGNDGVNRADYLGLDFIAVAKTNVDASLSNAFAPGEFDEEESPGEGRYGHLLLIYWELECSLDKSDFKWRSDGKEWFTWHHEQGHKPEVKKVIELVPTVKLDGSTWKWKGKFNGGVARDTFSFSVIRTLVGEAAQQKANEASKIRPLFDGWPDTKDVKAKWKKIEDYSKNYKFAEQEGFTTPENFPSSVYGHPTGGFSSGWYWQASAGRSSFLKWPFNNSNTFTISALEHAGLGSSFIDSSEFPGNRKPEIPYEGFNFEVGKLWKVKP